VKLLDFGIAKANDGRLSQTMAGQVKGNVFFMAPEQARGEAVDHRADLYSLGLVMYAMLTNDTLYQGTTSHELLSHCAYGLTDDDWEKIRQLPSPAKEVLEQALQFSADQRFASAEAFAVAIGNGGVASFSELAATVQRLFGEELKADEERFRTDPNLSSTTLHGSAHS
jgi:serine/threonine protein kinase